MPKPRGAASHAGAKKAFDKRVRITEQQKAETVQHFMLNPAMSYTDLGEWCKEQFKFFYMSMVETGKKKRFACISGT